MSNAKTVGVALLLMLGLNGLMNIPAYAENSKQKTAVSDESKLLKKQTRTSKPITSKKDLRARFDLSKKRAATISIGKKGKANVRRFVSNDNHETGYECSPNGCSCHGDLDCNLMFTQVCSDPSTGGSCTGNVCTCTP